MSKVRIQVEGLEDVQHKLREAGDKARKIADRSVSKVADKILGESRDVAPFETGRLRASSDKKRLKELDWTLFYDTPYAARLHEHPELRFKTPGTGAKYLERPLMNNVSYIQTVIAGDINKLL